MTLSEPFNHEISIPPTYGLWQDCSDHNEIPQCYSFCRNVEVTLWLLQMLSPQMLFLVSLG